MNFTDTQFDSTFYVLAWLIWLPVLLRCILKADWAYLNQEGRVHFWLGSAVVLTLLWSMKAGVQPGLDIHLLGANLLMLAFGPELAFLTVNMVMSGIALNGGTSWEAFALNVLVMGGVSIWVSYTLWRTLSRRLPELVFIFIFLNGFFSAGITLMSVGFTSTVLLSLTDQYSLVYLLEEYLPYYLLLGFSESWLTGMVVTLLVVYRPEWLKLFDAPRYFKRSDQKPGS